jgi:hypothetical protein
MDSSAINVRKLAFILISLTILLAFALILGNQAVVAGAADATATPTIHIGFGCIRGCTPIPPWPVMPTSAPTALSAGVRERLFLPFVGR